MSDLPPFRFDDDPPRTFRADLADPWVDAGETGGDPYGDAARERPDPRLRRKPRLWPILRGLIWLTLVLAVVGGASAAYVYFQYIRGLPQIPPQAELYAVNVAPGMTFLDRAGQVIAVRGPRHGRRVVLRELPSYVAKAFLAAEDRRFYEHGPVDWWGAARAARANFDAGGIVEGGSTLSQQLARTLFLKPERTFTRKIREAALAARLEEQLSKDAILELYLNRIFFGANAYGIDAASQTYFAKPATALTLSEAALLAALPKAPSRLSPTRDMPAALNRQKLVLDRMVEEGWITASMRDEAVAAPPVLAAETPEDQDFGWVLDMAQSQAQRLAAGQAGDLVVRLSIDQGLQRSAAAVVRRTMEARGRRAGVREAALVALAPDGGVRAMVGGMDHRFSAFNRAVQAQRQPGSAFKPFVFAAALEAGIKPTDIREDKPVRLGPWSPKNYGGRYLGPMTVENALVRSVNTVAVRLTQEVGPDKVADLAARFGLTGIPGDPGLSLGLGAYESNLLEMTGGYQVLQQQGRRSPPFLIEGIATSAGKVIYAGPARRPVQVYDAARAGEMVRMMKGVIERGTGRRAAFGRPAAGKTGTSQAWRDAWFIGFTPDWTAGVWVGNDDNAPMAKVAGGDLPAEIWRRFMTVAHDGQPVRDFPWLGAEATTVAAAATGAAAIEAAEARSGFYDTLASEFARAAVEAEEPEPAG